MSMSDEKQGESSRSTFSPAPPAPVGFNPPADTSPESIDQAIAAVSPPILEVPDAAFESPRFAVRPSLEALRQTSGQSSGYSSQSSGIASVGSEGGEHLEEARNDLVNTSTSREGSDEEVGSPEPSDQSWDSVWPTQDTLTRSNSSYEPQGNRHPVLAPVSPFVTPSFSPALFPNSKPNPARRSSPPRRSESPARRPSPLTTHSETFTFGRRQSITSDRPLLNASASTSNITITRHQRSFSSSSDSSPRMLVRSPPASPRRQEESPRRESPVAGPSRKSPDADVPILDTDGLPPIIPVSPVKELFAPIARPGTLRRALSDYERPPRPTLVTRASLSGDLPRASSPIEDPPTINDIPLVDEGDLLPETDLYVDIIFEDEGLNTLERIFLLSKSDFAFHRAYIARVLGDLLYDVDPCESVEYVLPLISSFTLDEDEGVREAFAQDLHRIIWYFYSVCQISPAGTEAQASEMEAMGEEREDAQAEAYEDVEEYFEQAGAPRRESFLHRESSGQTVTVTSAGIDMVNRPTPAEIRDAPPMPSPPHSLSSGPTSDTSQLALTAFDSEGGTGETTASSMAIDQPAKAAPDTGPILHRPTLPVDFFTPLLGSLLLNANTVISESVRTGLVYLIARLKEKEKEEWPSDRWGTIEREVREKQSFPSQTGPHSHEFHPIPTEERDILEKELLDGIVIGMGGLSTEVPDYDEMSLEDSQTVLETYASSEGRSSLGSREKEAFHFQLIAEATAGRATSMNLIGALCDFYTGEEAVHWGFVEEVLACQDGDVVVRAEGAVALSMLAKIVPAEYIDRFIPLFESLANDEVAQVRQSACLSLPSLCGRIESTDYRRSFAVKAMHSLTTHSADVRCAALEVLGELIYVFAKDPKGPPVELMQVYMDEEDVRRGFGEDWDTVASFNFPGVALTIGPGHWSEIQPLYHRMNERAGEKPRRTLAASLHELAKILTPDQCATDLIPVYRSCMSSADDIRELVFEHIDVFLDNLPLDLAWETYLELAKGWKENKLGGWRAREQLALHIPAFFRTFHSLMKDEILGMLKDALFDPFAAVRDAATKGIPECYEILGDESDVANRFREGLLDLGRSERYRQRVTFVRCLREFVKPPPNRQAFEDFFLPFLGNLSRDVVDVRLGLAQTVADLFVIGAFYADRTHAPKSIYDLAGLLAKDESVDVRDTIKNVDLDHLESNDTVPYEIKSPQTAKRGVTPSDLDTRATDVSPPSPKSSTDTTSSIRPSVSHRRSNSFRHQIRIDRRPSPDALIERTRLDRRLLTPTTPGTPSRRGRVRETDGHYISTPSPNEPPGGMDPFSLSFGAATPEGSPAGRAAQLESPS